MRVKAIVKTRMGPGAECTTFEIPEMDHHDVLVQVKACAICGTDVHNFEWNEWVAKNFIRMYGKLPRVLGHEFSGEVVAVGSHVTKIKVGDRIAAETHVPCGNCYLCRSGHMYNCRNLRRFKTGVFADYAVIPECTAEIIPNGIPYHIAALFEPFGVAVHAASRVRLVGDSVAVVGSGPIGLFSILLAKAMGASTIIATDVVDYRLSLAKIAGAHYVLNARKENVGAKIKEITDGLGVGIVIECSGDVKAMKQGFELLRKCGTYVMTGLPSEPLVLNAGDDIIFKGATVYGIFGREMFSTWEIAKNLVVNKQVDLEPLITHRFGFEDFEEAFELSKSGQTGKVLLFPAAGESTYNLV